MGTRLQTAFLILICAQAAHSIEEYLGKLWEVLTPARMVSALFSDDFQQGFAIANFLIVLLGVLCYLGPIRHSWKGARIVAWFWAVLEFSNGSGHILFAIEAGAYFPGVYTAPFLLAFSGLLGYQLVHSDGKS